MYISKGYNFIEPEVKIEPKIVNKEFESEGLTPWKDYNNKHSIFDVISDDFRVLSSNSSKYYQIKRHGGDSAHSGYVFKDSGCMFLFSTATIYPHEKLISPFAAYSIKHHNGNFSAAASRLYSEGYGDRVKKVVKELSREISKIQVNLPKKDLEFPIDIFDEEFQNNDEENEYLKSMYPKQKSYIPRFALILNTMHSIYKNQKISLEISKDSILKAEKLSKYFIANAKKIKFIIVIFIYKCIWKG